MIVVRRGSSLGGAAQASGATVVIDVFRAFTTAAFALAQDVERLVLAAEVEEARTLAAELGGAVLIGEEGGRRPCGFDLGNSPAEVLRAGLRGARIVQRTSAGTRVVAAALRAGAVPVLAASFVVAGSTALALRRFSEVTLIGAGYQGEERAEEDEACADLLEALLRRASVDRRAALERAFRGPGGSRLREEANDWAHPADLGLCLAVDLFRFWMVVEVEEGLVTLRRRSVEGEQDEADASSS